MISILFETYFESIWENGKSRLWELGENVKLGKVENLIDKIFPGHQIGGGKKHGRFRK
jgi:hypothetical protein